MSCKGTVTPFESFKEATVLWVAQVLIQDNGRTCWVRLFKITEDEIMTYQNSRVAMLEPLDTGELPLHLKQIEETADVEDLDNIGEADIANTRFLSYLLRSKTLLNKNNPGP